MKKSSEYLQHAKTCRTLAKRAKVEEHREMLANMAASWEMLAQSRSRGSQITQDEDEATP
jgi:hypothetical protein